MLAGQQPGGKAFSDNRFVLPFLHCHNCQYSRTASSDTSRAHDRAPPRTRADQAAHALFPPSRSPGVEERYASVGGSRVQIPPPALNGPRTRMVERFAAVPVAADVAAGVS